MASSPMLYDDMVREHVVQQVLNLLFSDTAMVGGLCDEYLAEKGAQMVSSSDPRG